MGESALKPSDLPPWLEVLRVSTLTLYGLEGWLDALVKVSVSRLLPLNWAECCVRLVRTYSNNHSGGELLKWGWVGGGQDVAVGVLGWGF
jgi:hypothetical protein